MEQTTTNQRPLTECHACSKKCPNVLIKLDNTSIFRQTKDLFYMYTNFSPFKWPSPCRACGRSDIRYCLYSYIFPLDHLVPKISTYICIRNAVKHSSPEAFYNTATVWWVVIQVNCNLRIKDANFSFTLIFADVWLNHCWKKKVVLFSKILCIWNLRGV